MENEELKKPTTKEFREYFEKSRNKRKENKKNKYTQL